MIPNGTNMIPRKLVHYGVKWSQNGTNMGPLWYQMEPIVEPVWCQMHLTRYQNGSRCDELESIRSLMVWQGSLCDAKLLQNDTKMEPTWHETGRPRIHIMRKWPPCEAKWCQNGSKVAETKPKIPVQLVYIRCISVHIMFGCISPRLDHICVYIWS